MKTLSFLSFAVVLTMDVHGASLVVDSFTEGLANLSTGHIDGESLFVITPFGTQRYFEITSRSVTPGTVLTASINPDVGQLQFTANGSTTVPSAHLYTKLFYDGGSDASIIGYTGVFFSLRNVTGEGVVGVATGASPSGIPDPNFRVELTEPGEIFYPIEKIRRYGEVDLNHISSLNFLFTATSEQFSFTLDEIRFVVPEPASLALLASGTALVLCRRRASFTPASELKT